MTECSGQFRRGDMVPMDLLSVEEVVAMVGAALLPPVIEVEEHQAAGPSGCGGVVTHPLLFHVSETTHQASDNLSPDFCDAGARVPTGGSPSIEPGQLGDFLWAFTLETAQLAVAPAAPSRLRCIFVAETLAMARTFRDRFRSSAWIYSVRPWPDAVLFCGPSAS